MGVIDTIRNALYGNPPSPGFKPSRDGVFNAFSELNDRVTAVIAGIQSYATVSALPVVTASDNGKTARVYADPTSTNNTFWVVKAGAWVKDTDFVNILVAVVQPSVTAAQTAANTATASAAAIANTVVVSGSTDLLTLTDTNGFPTMVIGADGRAFASDGLPVTETRGEMFEALLWRSGENANTNMVRWPEFSMVSEGVMHLFAGERYGPPYEGAAGENGIRNGFRVVNIDFAAKQVTSIGAFQNISTPSGWSNMTGRAPEIVPIKITQGIKSGITEIFSYRLSPDNVTYQTAGTQYDLYRNVSTDNYAATTKLFDGNAVYTALGKDGVKPPNQRGLFLVGNCALEIPADRPNAGRRIVYAGLWNGSIYLTVPIYAEKDSDVWNLGAAIDPSIGTGVPSVVNEITCTYADGKVRLYIRNDDQDGSQTTLTNRGRTYLESVDGVTNFSAPAYLSKPSIGNVQAATVTLPDGSVLISGSISPGVGVRLDHSYFLSRNGRDFTLRVDSAFTRSRAVGYGAMHLHQAAGRWWIIHVFEVGDGQRGFNASSHIVMRAFTLEWLMRQVVLN